MAGSDAAALARQRQDRAVVVDHTCRHCNRRIIYVGRFSNWVHYTTGSVWCDLGASLRAQP